MNWIVLHAEVDGHPIRINAAHMTGYDVDPGGAGALVGMVSGETITVGETPEDIDDLIAVLRPTYAPVGFLGEERVIFGDMSSSPPRAIYDFPDDGPATVRSQDSEQRFGAFDHHPIKD